MWIKICANTSVEDALLAAEAAADAVGYVFAPSRRRVTSEEAARIAPKLPPELTQIGVFLTRDFDEIVSTVRTAGLHGIQLHGGPEPNLSEKLRNELGETQFLIETVHWRLDSSTAEAEQQLRNELRTIVHHGLADAVLIDAKTATAAGGTGRTLDWNLVRQIVSAETDKLRIILAGGLHPANVAEAIHTFRPWGVDVASGVESEPGKKDTARLRAFIAAARAAFAQIENVPAATAFIPRS